MIITWNFHVDKHPQTSIYQGLTKQTSRSPASFDSVHMGAYIFIEFPCGSDAACLQTTVRRNSEAENSCCFRFQLNFCFVMVLFFQSHIFLCKIAPPWLQSFYTCLIVHRNLYGMNIVKALLEDTITHWETRSKDRNEDIKQKKPKMGLPTLNANEIIQSSSSFLNYCSLKLASFSNSQDRVYAVFKWKDWKTSVVHLNDFLRFCFL